MGSFLAAIRDTLIGPPPDPLEQVSRTRRQSSQIPLVASLIAKENLRGIEPNVIQLILDTIPGETEICITFEDIVGQDTAIEALIQSVIKPARNPDLYKGDRAPSKGILFFGPPGNGKSILAEAVANAVKEHVTVFYITSATLTSKFYGETAKGVKALFAVAKECQPSIIFIDEMDSILGKSDNEHNETKMLRKQFQTSMEGLGSKSSDRFVVIGTTNYPKKLPKEILRRFDEQIYIKPADFRTRIAFLKKKIPPGTSDLKHRHYREIAQATEFYSLSALSKLVKKAYLKRNQEIPLDKIKFVNPDSLRGTTYSDFTDYALKIVRPDIDPDSLKLYEEYNEAAGVVLANQTSLAVDHLNDADWIIKLVRKLNLDTLGFSSRDIQRIFRKARYNLDVNFDDVVGLATAKDDLQDLCSMHLDHFCPSNGILLFGPPGTGKALLIKALAKEIKATLFSVSQIIKEIQLEPAICGEIFTKLLIAVAKKCQPSIIFIEYPDISETPPFSSSNACKTLMSQLYLEMADFKPNPRENIIIIGKTYKLDVGVSRRFRKKIFVPLLSDVEWKALLEKFLSRDSSLSKTKSMTTADYSEGYSRDDLDYFAYSSELQADFHDGDSQLSIGLFCYERASSYVRPSLRAKSLESYYKFCRDNQIDLPTY